MSREPFLEKMKRYADDFDKHFAGKQKIETENVDHDGLEEIEVTTGEAEVVIRTHKEDNVAVELKTYEEGPILEMEREGSMLKINAERVGSHFSIGWMPNVVLTVRIPDRLWNSLAVDTRSGSIEISGADISRLGAKTNSGELDIKQMKADEASLRTSSGEITIKQLESRSLSFAASSGAVLLTDVGGDIYGKTNSGEIEIDDFEGGELELKNKSGGIDARNITADRASFRTTSGEIDVDELSAKESLFEAQSGEITCRGLSGDVNSRTGSGEVRLDFAEPGQHISVDTKSGDIELRQHGKAWNAGLKVFTSSGDIHVGVAIDQSLREGDKRLEGTFGEGEGQIELSSHSGDIEVS